MREKQNVFSITTAVLSLVVLGYILFISVFNQIIAQNEGFFYMIVFGGILILAFILLSLVTKLLAVSHEVEERKLWYVAEAIVVVLLFVLFINSKLSYTSSLPVEDAVFYKTAVLLQKGTLSVGGMDILPQLMRNPAQYTYAVVVSLIFMITGSETSSVVYINTAVLLLTAFFVYRIVRKTGGRVCGVFALACSLFMPSQAFAVYTYSPEVFFACIFFMALNLFVYLSEKTFKKKAVSILFHILQGVLFGILIFTEPISIVIIVLLLIDRFRQKDKGWLKGIAAIASMLIVFVLCSFAKCSNLECSAPELFQAYMGRFVVTSNAETGEQYDIGRVVDNFHSSFDTQDTQIINNYYFLTKEDGQTYTALQAAWFQLGNQLLYLFFIVLSIACVFYLLRGKKQKVISCLLALIGSFIALFFGADKENNTYFFVELLIIIGCSSLHYMYENHHPSAEPLPEDLAAERLSDSEGEQDLPVETEEEMEARLARARALVFIGENEMLYEEIKSREKINMKNVTETLVTAASAIVTEPVVTESAAVKVTVPEPAAEIKKPVKLLDNPLPLPKPHVAKEMEYQIDTAEDMDFDFDVKEDDDFDV